jgi:hypothetical protein
MKIWAVKGLFQHPQLYQPELSELFTSQTLCQAGECVRQKIVTR